MITRSDALDDAHERLSGYGYFDVPGFAFHGPMGAETLSTLGHNELVAGWVEDYKRHHQPLDVPPRVQRLDPTDEESWRSALGNAGRISDWAEMFREELWDQPWPAVLQNWLGRLLPGCGGGLTHGLIRVAHGVRALPIDRAPSGLLLDELARGLAYWAATFTVLPGPPDPRGRLALPEAITHLPRPEADWSPMEAGSFSRLSEVRDFPDAVASLKQPDCTDCALGDLTAWFCGALLTQSGPAILPLVHTVTPTAAARILLPYLQGTSIELMYARLWQISAAITIGFARPFNSIPAPESALSPSPSEVLALAVEHRDTHALKFTEACAREYALYSNPVYLVAANHVLHQLRPW